MEMEGNNGDIPLSASNLFLRLTKMTFCCTEMKKKVQRNNPVSFVKLASYCLIVIVLLFVTRIKDYSISYQLYNINFIQTLQRKATVFWNEIFPCFISKSRKFTYWTEKWGNFAARVLPWNYGFILQCRYNIHVHEK